MQTGPLQHHSETGLGTHVVDTVQSLYRYTGSSQRRHQLAVGEGEWVWSSEVEETGGQSGRGLVETGWAWSSGVRETGGHSGRGLVGWRAQGDTVGMV